VCGRLVLQYVAVCILVLGLECVIYSNVVYGRKNQTVQCGGFGAVLCYIMYIDIVFLVSCDQQCCV